MDVDQSNLMEKLKLIETKLPTCEFVSLHVTTTHRIEDKVERVFFNDYNDFYKCCLRALKDNHNDFQPIEIALVIWRLDAEGDTTYLAFNFPIFPSPSTLLPMRKRSKFFTLDDGVISRLLERDFQFNPWIKDSVSHLTIFEHDLAKEKLHENQNETSDLNLQGDDKVFMEDMVKKMEEFLADKGETQLRFPSCNGWRRRLIYQTFKAEPYNKTTFLQTCKVQKDTVIANKLSEEEVKERLNEYFTKQIGFLSVFKLIINSQKPLVGFNIFSDLLIYYKTFWTFPPQHLDEFKEVFRSLFPLIIDIRHMAEGTFDNESLDDLFLELDTKYRELAIAKRPNSASKAFKVGTTFIKLLTHFYKQEHPTEKFILSQGAELMERFKNIVYIHKNYDLKAIDLSNNDTIPERENLRVVRILAEDRFLDIEEYLKETNCEIVTWFNDDEFLVTTGETLCPNDEQATMFQVFHVDEYFAELDELEESIRLEMEEAKRQAEEEVDEEPEPRMSIVANGNVFESEMKLPRDDDSDTEKNDSVDMSGDQVLLDASTSDEEEPIKPKRAKKDEGLFTENADWTCDSGNV